MKRRSAMIRTPTRLDPTDQVWSVGKGRVGTLTPCCWGQMQHPGLLLGGQKSWPERIIVGHDGLGIGSGPQIVKDPGRYGSYGP